MEIKLKYITKKIINKIQIFFYRKNIIYDNILIKNNFENKNKIKKILIYFPNYEFMHLGDHLFFEPLASILVKNNFDIHIEPIKNMEFYFQKLGFKIGNILRENYDLIITRIEFLSEFKKYKKPIIFIDIINSKIKKPLCIDIAYKVLKVLNIENLEKIEKPRIVKISNKNNLINQQKKYIIFNNYIDSGSFRIRKVHQETLITFVKNLKNKTGFSVIHLGSKEDFKKDNKYYDFVDLDLRGKTSIEDLFNIVQLDCIVYCVSFDAFIMHLFLICNKKTYILFRGRFLKRYHNLIIKYFNPPFFVNNKQEIIEYI